MEKETARIHRAIPTTTNLSSRIQQELLPIITSKAINAERVVPATRNLSSQIQQLPTPIVASDIENTPMDH